MYQRPPPVVAPHMSGWSVRVSVSPHSICFGTTFVLLIGRTGTAWCQAATEVAQTRHVPFRDFTVGPEGDLADPKGSWAITYGVEQDGAVLVRPDGYVAWRCQSNVTNPAQALQGVLASVLGEMATQAAQLPA